MQRRIVENGVALLISIVVLLSCCVFGTAEEKKLEIFKDGEFDVPKVIGGDVGLINKERQFNEMMREVLDALAQLNKTSEKNVKKGVFDQEQIQSIISEFGDKGIECLVRIREPYMIPVFDKLLDSDKWWIRRLAIFGLQRNIGLSKLSRITDRLKDDSFLVREIAAMTIAIFYNIPNHSKHYLKVALWTKEEQKALKAMKSKKNKTKSIKLLKAALKVERNPYVRSAFDAAIRALGKFKLGRICSEFTSVDKDTGITYIKRVGKPTGSGNSKSGGNSKMKPSKNWCYPIAIYPHEVISGISSDEPLVPLSKKNNSLHFGHDCAWMLDGAGIYSIADGQIRTTELAGDFGVLIIGEYKVEEGKYVSSINGHCSQWVFAAPGEVKCRQLIGAVGLGFSFENGIYHAAHNHFGMRSEKYDRTKCYGRGASGTPIKGWLVPAKFLGPMVEGKEIDPDSY